MVKTKSVKSVGRFGPRYGSSPRKRALVIETKGRIGQKCPKCKSANTLSRLAAGLWECNTCGIRFAGGAYVSQTTLGKTLTPEELKSTIKSSRQ